MKNVRPRGPEPPSLEVVLDESFGVMPDLELPPRSEWERGYG